MRLVFHVATGTVDSVVQIAVSLLQIDDSSFVSKKSNANLSC